MNSMEYMATQIAKAATSRKRSVEMVSGTADAACSDPCIITLQEGDIEGAALEEPLESKTIPQLDWWLLCHVCDAHQSERKPGLIVR